MRINFNLFLFLLFLTLQSFSGLAQVSVPYFKSYNKYADNSPGYYIFAASNKLMIIDNFGTSVFCKQVNTGALEFNMQEDGYLYYYVTKSKEFYKLDSSFNIIDTLKIKNGFDQDYHELIVKENGDAYLFGHQYHVIDMSSIYPGGNKYATVVEEIIQVLDKNKNVKFEWKSLDHTNILDADSHFVDFTSSLIDYMHINSFDVDENGDIYISSRHLNEITKINGVTGEIIWRMGGRNNEFSLVGDSLFFSGQHSIKVLPGSKILLFDNGNVYHPEYSRGVEYKINEELKTIEFIKEYRILPDIYTAVMGNIQRFENGNTVIGWGKNDDGILLSEFDMNDSLIVQIESPEQLYSYSITKIDWKTNLFKSNIDSVSFGEVDFGTAEERVIIVTNNSENDIEISSYSTHDTIFKVVNELPLIISAKNSVELVISYTPSRFGGNSFDILTLNSDGIDPYENPYRIGIQIKLTGSSQDTNPPLITTYPTQNSTNIPVDTNIWLCFDEPVRFTDNSKLTNEQIKNSIDLRKNNAPSIVIPYNVTIDSANYKIQLSPFNLLEPGQAYTIKIYADFEDFSDNVMAEKQIIFTTEQTTTVNLENQQHTISLFPNPTAGSVFFNNVNQIEKVIILTITGEIIYPETKILNNELIINLENHPNGIYVINLYCIDGSVITNKVIKL
jgi:hypothetical protein